MSSQPSAVGGRRCRHGSGGPGLQRSSLALMLLLAALSATTVAASRLPPPPAATTQALADWRICDEGVFTVDGGGAEPEVARRGSEVTFTIEGTLDRNVSGGVLECWVDYLGFHVYSKTGDLCEAVPCPLAAGRHTLRLRQRLPSIAPPGPYLGVFQATASDGTLLFCVDLNFRVGVTSAISVLGGGAPSGGKGGEGAAAVVAAA